MNIASDITPALILDPTYNPSLNPNIRSNLRLTYNITLIPNR